MCSLSIKGIRMHTHAWEPSLNLYNNFLLSFISVWNRLAFHNYSEGEAWGHEGVHATSYRSALYFSVIYSIWMHNSRDVHNPDFLLKIHKHIDAS